MERSTDMTVVIISWVREAWPQPRRLRETHVCKCLRVLRNKV